MESGPKVGYAFLILGTSGDGLAYSILPVWESSHDLTHHFFFQLLAQTQVIIVYTKYLFYSADNPSEKLKKSS